MSRHLAILLSIYLCLVVQSSIVAELPEVGRPFLPAFLLVMIAMLAHPAIAVIWSGLVGLLLDGLSVERLGVQVGLAAVLALGLQLMKPLWKSCHPLVMVAMCLTVAGFWRVLSPMTLAVLSGRVINPDPILNSAVCDAISTAVFASALFLAWFMVLGNRLRKRTA